MTQLEVIGGKGLQNQGHKVRYVDRPNGRYDVVISNSLLLEEGRNAPLLAHVAPEYVGRALRLRRAENPRSERKMQWSHGFRYD